MMSGLRSDADSDPLISADVDGPRIKSHLPCSTNEINSQAWVECISLSNRTCKAASPRGVSEKGVGR